MASTILVEKRNELNSQRKKLKDIFDEAAVGGRHEDGRDYDFTQVKSLKGSTNDKVDEVRKMNAHIEELQDEVTKLADIEKISEKYQSDSVISDKTDLKPNQERFTDDKDSKPKGWGDLFVESAEYKKWHAGQGNKEHWNVKADPMPLVKTVFETSAGWAPESIRIGRFVDDAQRQVEVIDIVPVGATGMAAVVFMEETTFTNAADFRAEAAAYAENAFAMTEQSVTVRSIGASIPITDEQMADVAQVRSYLNQRMAFTVRQQLDAMLLTGSGSGVEWAGVNNFTAIQTQALGTDPVPDAIYKALDLVRFTGRAVPSNVVIHPNDWQPVRLLRTADGIYIWGNPSEAGPLRIWGLPVLITSAQTENTGLVGDFRTFCQYFVRQDMAVEMGFVNDDFLDGRITIRAGIRGALVGFRGAAFCQVTGL